MCTSTTPKNDCCLSLVGLSECTAIDLQWIFEQSGTSFMSARAVSVHAHMCLPALSFKHATTVVHSSCVFLSPHHPLSPPSLVGVPENEAFVYMF